MFLLAEDKPLVFLSPITNPRTDGSSSPARLAARLRARSLAPPSPVPTRSRSSTALGAGDRSDLYFLCVFLAVFEVTRLISRYSFYLAAAAGWPADVP